MKEADQGKSSAWWVWLVAASFLLDFGLVLRGDWSGPTLGLRALHNQGSVTVFDVNAPSETVPLRQGDRIIRADGQVISSDADWHVILFNLRVGTPVIFEIERDKQYLQLSVTPGPRWSVGFFRPGTAVLFRIGQMMMLGVACFVAFARPRNSAALLTALFFAGMSVLNHPSFVSGFAAMLRDLPLPIVGLLFIAGIASALMGLFLFLFCVTFPRRLIQSPWILALLCIPELLWFVPVEIYSYRLAYDPRHAIGMFSESLYLGMNITSAAYFVADPFGRELLGHNTSLASTLSLHFVISHSGSKRLQFRSDSQRKRRPV
jgi:hypothetical protein